MSQCQFSIIFFFSFFISFYQKGICTGNPISMWYQQWRRNKKINRKTGEIGEQFTTRFTHYKNAFTIKKKKLKPKHIIFLQKRIFLHKPNIIFYFSSFFFSLGDEIIYLWKAQRLRRGAFHSLHTKFSSFSVHQQKITIKQ